MRPRPSVDDSSEESEYAEFDVDDGMGLNTDLMDVDTCTDEDDKQWEGTEDEAWLFPDEDHTPEHYLQQLKHSTIKSIRKWTTRTALLAY
jgi:hypothetical protein